MVDAWGILGVSLLAALALAPSTGELVVERGDRLLSLPAEGGAARVLTHGGGAACSDSAIAFGRDRPDSMRGNDVFILRDGKVARVTDSAGSAEDDLAWSPDGRRLVFGVGALLGSYDLWLDGRPLTRMAGDEMSPSWSPSGRRLAFSARRGIYVISVRGGPARRVAQPGGFAAWSARDRIAYVHWRGSTSNLASVSAAGGESNTLARMRGSIGGLAWSPDGRQLAFSRTVPAPDLKTHVYLVAPDGTNLHWLAEGTDPVWSPDGTRLAYSAADGVWVIGADGSGRRRVVRNARVSCWRVPSGTGGAASAGSRPGR